jgi:hypothetical protein
MDHACKMKDDSVIAARIAEFYSSWLVHWLRGSKDRVALQEELTRRTTGGFGWVTAHGVAYSGTDWSTCPEYPYACWYASAPSLRMNVRGIQVLDEDQEEEQEEGDGDGDGDGECVTRLVTCQVWTTTTPGCADAGKQVTVWMTRNEERRAGEVSSSSSSSGDSAAMSWKIAHIHETWIHPKEPPLRILQPPWAAASTDTATPVWFPSRRRHYLYPQMMAHGGQPFLLPQPQPQPQPQPKQKQQEKHQQEKNQDKQVVGISIKGWDIGTSQGPIGDSQWFDRALKELEPLSQPGSTTTTGSSNNSNKSHDHPRQLALPEMVFPHAYVVLDYNNNSTTGRKDQQDRRRRRRLLFSWNAMDFLKEWASAHQAIPLPKSGSSDDKHDDIDAISSTPTASTTNPTTTTVPISSRGVSVLETSDASLWKKKTSASTGTSIDGEQGETASSSIGIISSTTFHFDWTYSSPYCGNLVQSSSLGEQSFHWKPLPVSGMPMHLLTDRTVPILLFDELVLVEDDLHDNGQMQFTIKMRVMPTCAYVLSQLFVRVDHVLLRLRETRWLVEFNGSAPKIYRDVTWRECRWEALGAHRLPTNVKAWTQNEYQPQEAASFAQLLQRLPQVAPSSLPSDIPEHSILVLLEDNDND